MNSYQLISKLRKVRGDTYLSTASQALYHELVAICNDMKWKEVFFIRSSLLCANLDISDNTLRKSRESLAGAQLIYYKTSKDRRIGCYYSFVKSIDDDVISSSISPAISSSKNADETSDDIAGENVSSNIDTSSISSSTSSAKFANDKITSFAISSVNFADESQIPHIIDNINIKQEDSLAHTHESSPLPKKKSRKEIKDEKPLVYPFSSIAFMSAWETLRQTPKWKKKLNYALQLSLDKLSKFEEEFAIRQVERAIESGWTGVVFTGTERDYQEWLNLKYNGSNRKTDAKPDESSAGIQSIVFGK
ncbi:hypothetical protein BUAKA3JSW_03606 [Bacteroides uniformis]|uniref:hypothetical protein n=1 Tax=Bacteroides uniformis TaxID=820 RepID=UPI0005CAA35E|nr:hypothetical protein [Bacteroides uniformis]CAH2758720.1 hypothetical protein BUAKA3JSW_03606 [Bacteroides uniformis]